MGSTSTQGNDLMQQINHGGTRAAVLVTGEQLPTS